MAARITAGARTTARTGETGTEARRLPRSIRAKLEKRGRPFGPLDNLIAGTATAGAHGATIVTRNVDEFSRVKGLRIANWYDA